MEKKDWWNVGLKIVTILVALLGICIGNTRAKEYVTGIENQTINISTEFEQQISDLIGEISASITSTTEVEVDNSNVNNNVQNLVIDETTQLIEKSMISYDGMIDENKYNTLENFENHTIYGTINDRVFSYQFPQVKIDSTILFNLGERIESITYRYKFYSEDDKEVEYKVTGESLTYGEINPKNGIIPSFRTYEVFYNDINYIELWISVNYHWVDSSIFPDNIIIDDFTIDDAYTEFTDYEEDYN